MRIAMVMQAVEAFGGMEEIVTSLAVALKRQGHQTAVVSTVWVHPDNQYKRYLERNGVPLVQWPFMELARPVGWIRAAPALLRTGSSARAAAALRRHEDWACDNLGWGYLTSKRHVPWTRRLLSAFALAWRPELIHVHSYVYDLNVTHVLEWTHARRMPTVFEEHQTPDPTRDVWRDFQARIDLATMVGAVSNKGAAVMREHLGVRRPIRVLPALVEDPMPALTADRIVPTPSATPTITTFARLIPVKGLTHLFEAIAALRTTHPQLRFRVYGEGPPRSREEIRTNATHWGLDPADVFAGTFRREELPGIMAATDVFVLSSLMEGFPLAIVEAMACGRAIVATA